MPGAADWGHDSRSPPISADVVAVVVSLVDGEPCVLTVKDAPRLPSGPLLEGHRSLQVAVRAWVEDPWLPWYEVLPWEDALR